MARRYVVWGRPGYQRYIRVFRIDNPDLISLNVPGGRLVYVGVFKKVV